MDRDVKIKWSGEWGIFVYWYPPVRFRDLPRVRMLPPK
jgi:hypothetical protein